MVKVDIDLHENILFHLLKENRVNVSNPEFPPNFDFLKFLVTFLKVKIVEDITIYLNKRVCNRILKAWYFYEFINDLKVFLDDPLILKLKNGLPDHCNDFFLPTRQWVHQ